MKKRHEKEIRSSCWNRAGNDELVFVLLGRDVAAPAAIRQWVVERIAAGRNLAGDSQTTEALAIADEIEESFTDDEQAENIARQTKSE